MSERTRAALYLALLIAAVVGVFAHGFANGASAFDDISLVFNNPKLENFGWAELREAFDPRVSRAAWGLQYTPLSDASYALDRKLFGASPGPYHLQGLLFHALAAAALFALVRRQGGSPECALLAGALFALHPLDVEAVTWISGRRTAIAGAFTLWAMLAWRRARGPSTALPSTRAGRTGDGSRAAYAASILFALLANLAKQSAVVTAPLLVLVEVTMPARRAEPRWRTALAYLPHVAFTAGFVAIGIAVGRREGLIVADAMPLAARARLAAVALGTYARMVAWPAHLQPMYRVSAPDSWGDPGALAGAAVAAGGLALVLACWRRAPLAAFGALLAAIAIAPGLHALGSQVVADRYAYLTVAGAAVPAALVIFAIARRERAIGLALAVAAVLVLEAATFLRIGVWRNDLALFSDAVASDPENGNARCLLGVALNDVGRYEEGEAELLRAASLSSEPPANGRWLVPLALMTAGGGREVQADLRGAESMLTMAVDLARPSEIDLPACGLAGFYVRRGAREKARAVLVRAIERAPERTELSRTKLARMDAGGE